MKKILSFLVKILIFLKEKIFFVFNWIFQFIKNSFKTKRKLTIVIGSILILAIIFVIGKFFIFRKKESKVKEQQLVKVKVAKIKRTDFSQKYSVLGTIKGILENELRFEVDGVLFKYNYKEGARIGKGNIIAYLDPKDAMAKVSYSKSKYESEKAAFFSAQQRLKVYEDLFKLKAISESKLLETKYEVEAIRQRMETASAELELSQSALLKTNLYAPSDGILAEIIVQPGEFVTPNDVVAKFVNMGDANFEVEIPEKDALQVKIGMKTKVYCDSYPDKEFLGIVSEISPIVKEKTRTVLVKIKISNTEGLLKSGMFARGEVIIVEASNVVTVPLDSVISLGGQTNLLPLIKPVTSVNKTNQAIVEFRNVKVENIFGKTAVISDGVEEGELCVVETTGELSDGILVEYIEIEEETSQKNQFQPQ
ncbi:MAG: efflux RND transporter periplasmic adaptor subunit [Candidatus Omnitrophica bacterium]|nr:efflux RND transporter periplasmic adaptor subunit [Candidatus Omnitrophota bacterium]